MPVEQLSLNFDIGERKQDRCFLLPDGDIQRRVCSFCDEKVSFEISSESMRPNDRLA